MKEADFNADGKLSLNEYISVVYQPGWTVAWEPGECTNMSEFLSSNGLGEYTNKMTQEGFDMEVLHECEPEDLTELCTAIGMKQGHKIKLRKALQKGSNGASAVTALTHDAAALFDEIDVNKNGSLSLAELRRHLAKFGIASEVAADIFGRMPQNATVPSNDDMAGKEPRFFLYTSPSDYRGFDQQ